MIATRTEIDDRDLPSLTPEECEILMGALLDVFVDDRKIQSAGLKHMQPFTQFSERCLSKMLQSLVFTGLLEKSGARRDAAYQLTPRGVMVKQSRQT